MKRVQVFPLQFLYQMGRIKLHEICRGYFYFLCFFTYLTIFLSSSFYLRFVIPEDFIILLASCLADHRPVLVMVETLSVNIKNGRTVSEAVTTVAVTDSSLRGSIQLA